MTSGSSKTSEKIWVSLHQTPMCNFEQLKLLRFKLLGAVAEELTDSIISSVNQIHKKEIEGISKKIQEAQSDESKFIREN
jgi:hypothetical protein